MERIIMNSCYFDPPIYTDRNDYKHTFCIKCGERFNIKRRTHYWHARKCGKLIEYKFNHYTGERISDRK